MTDVAAPDARAQKRDASLLLVVSLSLVAVCVAVVAMIVAGIANDGGDSASAGAPLATVHLSEFEIEPGDTAVASGGTLQVMNMGTAAHNLTIVGTGLATPDIGAGESSTLALTGVALAS